MRRLSSLRHHYDDKHTPPFVRPKTGVTLSRVAFLRSANPKFACCFQISDTIDRDGQVGMTFNRSAVINDFATLPDGNGRFKQDRIVEIGVGAKYCTRFQSYPLLSPVNFDNQTYFSFARQPADADWLDAALAKQNPCGHRSGIVAKATMPAGLSGI